MNCIITLIFFFGLALQGISQNLIRDYKKVADKWLAEYFDTTIFFEIKCESFTTFNSNGSGRFFYEENENKKIAFKTITFSYFLFDKALNDDIHFYISVDSKFNLIRDSSVIKRVPLCIRTSKPCFFISADSAKQISIADSIKYSEDLSSQLVRNKFDKEFYWIITGHKPSESPKTNKPSLNLYAESISPSQRRIINAQTGQIISYTLFDYDW